MELQNTVIARDHLYMINEVSFSTVLEKFFG